MLKEFEKGDLVVYVPADEDGRIYRCEIGVVKKVDEELQLAYVAYHTGDTCASTSFEDLLNVENSYAVQALADRMRQLGRREVWPLDEGCEDWSEDA